VRTAPPPTLRDLASRYSAAQRRTIDVALELFGRHSVGGTSLQMIADDLGVTKAAVYHQFHTKQAIVIAAVEVQLQPLELALEAAEASRLPAAETRETLLADVVDALIAHRRPFRTLQSDPVMFRLLSEHPPALGMFTRLFALLLPSPVDERSRVLASVLAATFGAVAYPFVIDLEDAPVRAEMLRILRRLLDLD
jgi:AcrR family transcriptional regulator